MIAMESEFEKATGLEFSLENLERVKHAFESDTSKAAAALKDTDSVIAMKLNKNGTITLKFDSGRELEVKEIYSDTGKLISKDDKDSKRASINLYNITYLENDLKFKELSSKDRLYKKVDTRV